MFPFQGGTRLGMLPANLHSPTVASWEPHRNRPVVPLIGDKRYYGEVPVWAAEWSGAGLEEKGAKDWASWEPDWVWRARRKAGDGRLPRRGRAHLAIPGCRKLPPMR